MLSEIAMSSGNISDELHGEDRNLLRDIPGYYILLYPGREDLNFERKQIIVEKFEISKGTKSECNISQISNFITGERAVGKLTSRSSRISFYLEYAKSYYVESSFLMTPLFFSKALRIFSGIYLDTAPADQHQVFASRFCMFSVNDLARYPRRYTEEDDIFKMWDDLLLNDVGDRNRLIARSGEEYAEDARRAARTTIEKGER